MRDVNLMDRVAYDKLLLHERQVHSHRSQGRNNDTHDGSRSRVRHLPEALMVVPVPLMYEALLRV